MRAWVLTVDELVDLLLVPVRAASHLQGLEVGDRDQRDVTEDDHGQDHLTRPRGAAAGDLVLQGVGDEGEEVHHGRHPQHVHLEVDIEHPPAVESPTKSKHIHLLQFTIYNFNIAGPSPPLQPPSRSFQICHGHGWIIIIISVLLMLPYIGQQGKKKATPLGSQQLTKEWAQIKKELDGKAKLCSNKISATVSSDFFKICRLKEIPDFYSNYLLIAVEKLPEQKVGQIMAAQIREIINHRSHYHKISDALDERPALIKSVESQLEVCEGFQDMNAGKTIKPANRTKINQLLKEATSLQNIKQVETKAISQLAVAIVKVRKNTVALLQFVKAWREYLLGLNPKKIKIKIVFPTSGFNCLLLPLFDQLPILNSFLCKEFNINLEQNPFMTIGKQSKRRNEFQMCLKQELAKDDYNYDFHSQELLAEFPVKEDPNKKEKQLQEQAREKEEQKIKWLKQIRQRSKNEGKLDEKKEGEGQKSPRNRESKEKSLNKKSKSLMDIESILLKHKQKRKKKEEKAAEENGESKVIELEQNKSLHSANNKKYKSVINIYGAAKQKQKQKLNSSDDRIKEILNQKAKLEKELKQAKTKNRQFQKLIKKIEKTELPKNKSIPEVVEKQETNEQKITESKLDGRAQFQNKVEAVYKSRHQKKISGRIEKKLNNSQLSVEELLNDKKSLEKELKNEIRQRKSLEKMLKKSEGQITKRLENSQIQKSKLQQKIQVLQSKIEGPKQDEKQILKRSKASIISVYMNDNKEANKEGKPLSNLYESKLIEQKQKRLSLEKQMKEILKEKTNLEKTIEKSQSLISKEKEAIERKVEKYEETIQKLKLQHNEFKLKKEGNTLADSRKKAESLRMYTTTPMKNEEKEKDKKDSPIRKQSQHVKSANYFKLPPEIKKSNQRQKTIQQKDEEQPKQKQIIASRSINKVQIIQTKKTIEIIYEAAKRNRKKKSENQIVEPKDTTVNNEQVERIKKEKQSLMYQLEREEARRLKEEKALERKALKEQGQLQKYKEIIERERERKAELENKIKNLKRELYQQYEERLKNEKMKFQEEKRELMVMIETEKGEKELKQKYLNNQIKFLKEMESNQNQLIKLLQLEKRNRLEKEKELAAEIAKKQELLQIIQIEQIKKGIESEIRKELENDIEEEDSQEVDLEERKDQLRMEIQEMNEERNEELEQIDYQNEKLKALIARIKEEESRLVSAIKENINDDEEDEEAGSILKTEERERMDDAGYHSAELKLQSNQKQDNYNSDVQLRPLDRSKISQRSKVNTQGEEKLDLEETEKVFQSRLRNQLAHQQKMHSQFKKIKESPQYKGKEQVQNIIEMYLQNPHQYPARKDREYSPEEKKEIEHEVLNKSKMAGDFQKELLQLKEVQKFVPTADDDIMTSHLLNLKRVYEEKESSALKEELFPSIKYDENYHDGQLSFESEETPPPKTIRQHVELHAKNFPSKKNNNSKNFLSINRMRVALLEEKRREAENKLIEEEAKRRAQAQVLKRVLKFKQDQRLRKAEEKEREKERKRKLEQQAKKDGKKPGKKKENKKKDKQSQTEQSNDETKSNALGKEKQHQQKQENHGKAHEEEHEEERISQKQEENEKQDKEEQQQEEQAGEFDTDNIEITNQHSSLDREKKQLEYDVHRYQDEIRSFVSREQKYQIYQQFVESSEIESYINNLLSISSEQIKGLNNNLTILKDIPGYTSLLILIAKDKMKQVEVGIGVFHKEYSEGLYVCDYVLAHNMRNFLNLVFNFSRYMFKVDVFTNKIEFFFDLNKLEDQISVIHFIEFQDKCKRMGEVYVKVGADKTRKYALRRNLFEPADKDFESEGLGVQFEVSLEIHSDLIRQRGYGFENTKNLEYFSTTALVSTYMKKNQQTLAIFRKNAQDDLKYRQLLLTALMFQKKEIDIKNTQLREMPIEERLEISKKLHNSFTIEDPTHGVQQLKLHIDHALAPKTKRCTFQIEQEQINYVITFPEQAVTKIQSSNSSQTGIFLNVVPKYKMLIIEANEFLSMHKVNPEINTFFYVKHFIKNIVDVGKEEHPRVFVPEVVCESVAFLKDLSDKMKLGVFGREKVKFGWSNRFNNSIVFTPSHKDLVIKKPFIISLMSAVVERAIEGTPLCATLIQ